VIYKKKILLILRDNIPTLKEANKWSIPGGGLEKGETHELALKRELKEEINIIPSRIEYLGSIKFIIFRNSFYLCRLTGKEFNKVKLGNEGQKIGWFSLEELKKLDLTTALTKYFHKYTNQLKEIVEYDRKVSSVSIGLKS